MDVFKCIRRPLQIFISCSNESGIDLDWHLIKELHIEAGCRRFPNVSPAGAKTCFQRIPQAMLLNMAPD